MSGDFIMSCDDGRQVDRLRAQLPMVALFVAFFTRQEAQQALFERQLHDAGPRWRRIMGAAARRSSLQTAGNSPRTLWPSGAKSA